MHFLPLFKRTGRKSCERGIGPGKDFKPGQIRVTRSATTPYVRALAHIAMVETLVAILIDFKDSKKLLLVRKLMVTFLLVDIHFFNISFWGIKLNDH